MTTVDGKALYSVHTVARYLYSLKKNISPLKLQKGLYFLFAFHGAVYKNRNEFGVFEGSHGASSRYLFDAEIQAWKYGPVIPEVYFEQRDNEHYADEEFVSAAVEEISSNEELKTFIDEIFEQVGSVSDFKLVDRSHRDDAWQNAYNIGQSTEMDKEEIIQEYIEKYV
jgi:uncharacterized phage-associated protein